MSSWVIVSVAPGVPILLCRLLLDATASRFSRKYMSGRVASAIYRRSSIILLVFLEGVHLSLICVRGLVCQESIEIWRFFTAACCYVCMIDYVVHCVCRGEVYVPIFVTLYSTS